jgi:hypothetical protein
MAAVDAAAGGIAEQAREPRRSRLGCMGIRNWFRKERKAEDAAAIARAQEGLSGESRAEREALSGDIEGLGADNRAARRVGGETQSGLDRLSD